MYQTRKKLLLLLLLLPLYIAGCKSRDPNPELRDPIYLDLKATVGDLTRDVATYEATTEDEAAKIADAEPNSKDLVLARKRHLEANQKLSRAQQKLRFFEIKLERRKLESRVSYEKSINSNAEWPNPKEFEAYLANKNLRNSSSSWSSRVPKLKDRIEQYNSKKAAPAPASSH